MARSALELLQSPMGLLEILAYLADRDAASPAKAIADLAMNRKTFYACLVKLHALGLVFKRRESGQPLRAYYGLTTKGQEAAKHLASLAPILAGSAANLERELESLRDAAPTGRNLARRGEILRQLAEHKYAAGEWEDALRFAEESCRLASEAGRDADLAHAELWIGKVLQKENDAGCLAHLKAAARAAKRAHEPAAAAEAAYVRGCHQERKGRYEEGEAEFRRCARLAERAKSDLDRGRAALGLGRILVERGRSAEAREPLESAREHLEPIGDTEELCAVYANLGAAWFPDDVKAALAWHEKAIRACELGGFPRMLAFELLNAAGCLQKLGDARGARRAMDRSREIAENLEDPKLIASVLIQSASVRSRQGDLRAAEADARRAIEIAQAEGLLRELANAHYLLGDILGKRRHVAPARESLERALGLFRRVKDEGMVRRLGELRNLKT